MHSHRFPVYIEDKENTNENKYEQRISCTETYNSISSFFFFLLYVTELTARIESYDMSFLLFELS